MALIEASERRDAVTIARLMATPGASASPALERGSPSRAGLCTCEACSQWLTRDSEHRRVSPESALTFLEM